MNKTIVNNKQTSQDLPYDSNPFTISIKGFSLFIDFAKGVFITMLVLGLIGFIINLIQSPDFFEDKPATQSSFNGSSNTAATETMNPEIIAFIILFAVGVIMVAVLVSLLISAAYKGFVAAGTVAAVERRNITAGQALSEMTDRFKTLFVAEVLAALRIIGGYLLFVVPGIRASLRYQSTPYIIMSNKDVSAHEALASSKKLYKKHLMEVFGILTFGVFVPVIGSSLSASGVTMSVKQLEAYDKAQKQTPDTHWLNYIGLLVVSLFVFLVIGFTVIYALLIVFIPN